MSTLEQIKHVHRDIDGVLWEGEDEDDIVQQFPKLYSDRIMKTEENPVLRYECRGWRQTGGCDPKGPREDKNDKACHEAVQGGSSGYCEFYDPVTNSIERLLESTCTTFRGDATFSCSMAKDILMFSKHADNYRHPYLIQGANDSLKFINHSEYNGVVQYLDGSGAQTTVSTEKKWYQQYLSDKYEYPEYGIVMVVYEKALVSLFASIKLLRTYHKSTLPIELWYRQDELPKDHPVIVALLRDFRDIRLREIKDPRAVHFYVKPYVIFFSHFQNILFLDADNFPLRDPEYLFATPEFQDTGALFWPDFWHPKETIFNIHDDSMLWTMLNISFVDMFEQESGQLVINRAKHEQALHMLMFYAFHRISPQPQPEIVGLNTSPPPTTPVEESDFEPVEDLGENPLPQDTNLIQALKLAWGDKDLFRFAWMKTNSSFYMIPKPPGSLGLWGWIKYMRPDATPFQRYCGQSMLQYDTTGEMLFLHRNTIKLNEKKESRSKIWQYIQEFRETSSTSNYTIKCWVENTYSCFGVTEGFNSAFTGQVVTPAVEALEDAIIAYADEAAEVLPPTPAPTTAMVNGSSDAEHLIPNMHHGRKRDRSLR
ncbi:hypothetical protein THRCLA_09853 [Thraustotheca clavata]|uniref:Uncharacterized protein n=1 Tax=Thraustotheca clavata TaxID=74557 RepID=A0A1V9YU62_9STRA|nr:hypothetical protein THRCLA_09853 [Thraustotheca clavata]